MAKQDPRSVTRTNVAKLAGTSVAVVSYVINNGPRPVSEATRQRVLEAIKQTGYRPNAVAQALASGTTKTYGLVVPNIANPFIASMAHVLLQASLDHGHIMLLGDAGDCRKRELELIQRLLNRQIDGLFYTSVDRHPYIDLIKASGTPFVMLDRVDKELQVNMLRVDERAAARQVTEHLLSHGYRDVGTISGPNHMLNAQDRLHGWRDAMQAADCSINESCIVPGNYTFDGGYQATKTLLRNALLPRALFISNEAQAFGCLRALAEENIAVPKQLALVCFNGTDRSAYNFPALTTVRQPLQDMARTAIALLHEWNGEVILKEFTHRLEIGESCGCNINKLEAL